MRRPRSRPRTLALALLGALAACGGGPPLPEQDLFLSVSLGADEVVTGRAFPLTVVRAWKKDLVPSAWDERALAPLVLRLEGSARREDDVRVEETLHYRAYAFSRDDVLVPGVKWSARPADGGPERSVLAPRRRLRVRPEVEAARPGPPELPGEPLAEPFPWIPWVGGAGGAVLLLLALWLRRRHRVMRAPEPVPAPAPPPAPPETVALARLAAIAGRSPADAADRRRDVVETAEVLRALLTQRFGLPARERTTEEVLATREIQGLDTVSRARIGDVLCGADHVKFAGHEPTSGERDALIGAATDVVTVAAARADR